MLERLLPARVDDGYRGHKAGLWLFGLVVALKSAVGFGTLLNGHDAATNADGIALASFGTLGGEAFISLFAAWGLAQLTLAALSVIVLVRYRALVPLMYALLLVEHLGRKLIFVVLPIARTGPAPGLAINVAIVALMVVGFVLALRWTPAR